MYTPGQNQKFGKYRILRSLGSSTSGTSYQAEDDQQQRTITLKLIHPWAQLPDQVRRQFFRDIQNISQLSHPLLSPLLNYGEIHGQLFVARPFISSSAISEDQGKPLSKTPMPTTTAFAYALQIARALAYIHKHGYMHGSLTLSNILIAKTIENANTDRSTPLLLTDIGLSSFVYQYGQPVNALLPITSAPEQFHHQQYPASDQYALATLLYFWLAGRFPFQGTIEEIQQNKQREEYPPLHTFNAQVTPDQEYLIQKSLRNAAKDRYPSMDALAQILADTLAQLSATTKVSGSSSLTRTGYHKEPQFVQQRPPSSIRPIETRTQETITMPTQSKPHQGEASLTPATKKMVDSASTSTPTQEESAFSMTVQKEHKITEPLALTPTILQPSSEAYLRITTSDHKGQSFTYHITQTVTAIGHAGDSDILLDHDKLVSRHHALIQRQGQYYFIYDQRSTYGTTVNAIQIGEGDGHKLIAGDQIHIGNYILTYYIR
jgi:Protein kinase domain./FHA domain.